MRVIWTLGQTTAQEITQILADSMDWKPATIKTLLGRLVKEVIWTEQEGKIHLLSSCLGDGNSSQCDGKSFPISVQKDWRDDCGSSRRSHFDSRRYQ